MEGNLRFKIDWASLIVGSKFIFFALFYFVCEGNFQVQATRWAYIWRGDLTEGFLRYRFGKLILMEGLEHGGAYFRNFTVMKLARDHIGVPIQSCGISTLFHAITFFCSKKLTNSLVT